MSDAPFFLLGSNGSGSTLLRLMLDSHERLALPPETGVMRLVTAHRWVPFWAFGGDWHRRLGLGDDDLDAALREFYGGMFRRYAESQGKQRWGEKTPFHIWHVDDIVRLFPDAAFVAIVRHPLGTVASMMRRFDRPARRATNHWLGTTQELVYQSGVVGDRLCLIRYEDLARDPERTMRELLDWLGEPWSPRVLHHHEVQPETSAARAAEGGTRPDEAVDPGRIDRWREWVNDSERRFVLDRTRPWARLLGYGDDPADVPVAMPPERAGRSMVVTGSELAARASGSDLDLTRPRRPWADEPLLPEERRRHLRAMRRAQSDGQDATRDLFQRLPPKLQRRVRDVRRGRPRGGS